MPFRFYGVFTHQATCKHYSSSSQVLKCHLKFQFWRLKFYFSFGFSWFYNKGLRTWSIFLFPSSYFLTNECIVYIKHKRTNNHPPPPHHHRVWLTARSSLTLSLSLSHLSSLSSIAPGRSSKLHSVSTKTSVDTLCFQRNFMMMMMLIISALVFDVYDVFICKKKLVVQFVVQIIGRHTWNHLTVCK